MNRFLVKALKACPAVLAVGTLLVGCGASGLARWLHRREDQPGGGEQITKTAADPDQFPEGIKAGGLVVCSVRQSDRSGFDQEGVQTVVGPCRLR